MLSRVGQIIVRIKVLKPARDSSFARIHLLLVCFVPDFSFGIVQVFLYQRVPPLRPGHSAVAGRSARFPPFLAFRFTVAGHLPATVLCRRAYVSSSSLSRCSFLCLAYVEHYQVTIYCTPEKSLHLYLMILFSCHGITDILICWTSVSYSFQLCTLLLFNYLFSCSTLHQLLNYF